GEAGGYLVGEGTPQQLAKIEGSHTAKAVALYLSQTNLLQASHLSEPVTDYSTGATPLSRRQTNTGIEILHAREHNLKNINLTIPRGQMTVITGPSGSGKSTLAFDILFSEGQRRYLESLNAYARQFVQPATRPDVDAIYGIPPTVAIEQRTSRGGRKSTVATVTEVYHFLRLLFVKLGIQHCPSCEVPIAPQSADSMLAQIMHIHKGQEITLMAPLVQARKGVYNEIAKWAEEHSYSVLRVDGFFVPSNPWPKLARYQEHNIELPVGSVHVSAKNEAPLRALLQTTLELGKGSAVVMAGSMPEPVKLKAAAKNTKPDMPTGEPPQIDLRYYSTKRACPSCARSFPELDPRLFSHNSKHGWCKACFGVGEVLEGMDSEQTGEEGKWLNPKESANTDDEDKPLQQALVCGACEGKRLNPSALAVTFHGDNIARLVNQTVEQANQWIKQLKLSERELAIAKDIQVEMAGRLDFLEQVGLGYLSLDRSAPSLSGGEAQRIRLASQLGTNLEGVCYVLDEPSIGLHPRDNHRLIEALVALKNKNNTLVVVEHDVDTMLQADQLVDVGPGAGQLGGEIIAQGTVTEVRKHPESLTGRYLAKPIEALKKPLRPVDKQTPRIRVHSASLHNLNNLTVDIPQGRLVVVTGVSGSGKSTLARDVLLTNMRRHVSHQARRRTRDTAFEWQYCDSIESTAPIERVLEVDQTPIGKTPRSCPATYIGFWNRIRNVMADTAEARMRGFKANRFSFNTGPGRCPVCEGQGMQT
ncbi:MAG: ATP-binding cassette domain-containing protein, partial [Limnobacter sp.]|nr:ATP-binding cassette domain-containing protein [Limnobacter sp.]